MLKKWDLWGRKTGAGDREGTIMILCHDESNSVPLKITIIIIAL